MRLRPRDGDPPFSPWVPRVPHDGLLCLFLSYVFAVCVLQFKSSLAECPNICSYLELCKVFVKLDQPNTAVENYTRGLEAFPNDVSLLIGIARIHGMMNDVERSVTFYKRVRGAGRSWARGWDAGPAQGVRLCRGTRMRSWGG